MIDEVKNTILIVIFCFLFDKCSPIHNPFSIEYNGYYYASKYSYANKLTVLSLNNVNNSSLSLNISREEIVKFPFSGQSDNLIVKIYPSAYNPRLIEIEKSFRVKVFCKFFYPIKVVAGNDKYQCTLIYKDKSGQPHLIGTCKLTLQYKSSLCLIVGSVNTEHLSNSHLVAVTGVIFHCNSQCIRKADLSWKSVVNTSLTLPLISSEHILWMTTYVKPFLNFGILIGVPKNPINKSTAFELPVKLKKNKNNDKINMLQLQVVYSKNIIIDDVIDSKCFRNIDPRNYEESDTRVTEIEVKRDLSVRCSSRDRDILFVLQVSSKSVAQMFNISIVVDYVFNLSQSKNDNQYWITVPLFEGRNTIVPVVNNPIIWPNFTTFENPYEFSTSDLQIYYLYEEISFSDVSRQVQCRPFNSSRLRCPSNMQPLSPILRSLEDPESLQWSMEILVNGLLLVLTVQPVVRPDDPWIVVFPDSVLNLISGWNAVRRVKDSSVITTIKCEPIYQVTEINIYKRIFFNDIESNKSMDMLVDMTNIVDINNIKLSGGIADIYKSGKSLVIQGIGTGSFVVELLTNDRKSLLKSAMTVYNEALAVTDMEVSCISNVTVLNKVSVSSASIRIAELQFQYNNLNGIQNCFFIVDVIFSDKSRTNIVSFAREHYSLKFITNTKIIEIADVSDMWYDYELFNRATSFHAELQESNYCLNPKTIFRKFVQLNVSTKAASTASSTTTNQATTNPMVFPINSPGGSSKPPGLGTKTEIVSTSSLRSIVYILIVTVSVVLVIILINIIVRYYKGEKYRSHRSSRRKSLNGTDFNNMLLNDKDYPPLLPPPGPQVQLSDTCNVTISSPHSFWCLDPMKVKRSNRANPFVRQSSLPVKGFSSRGFNEIAPCPPLRWANKMAVPPCLADNSYVSQEGLNNNTDVTKDIQSYSPMTWSVTHMDVEESSGVGSLNTNIDDMIKDPYGSRERFHKLSELPCSHSDTKEHVYEMV